MYEKNTLLAIRPMFPSKGRFKTAPEIRLMAICARTLSVNNQCYNPYFFGKIC